MIIDRAQGGHGRVKPLGNGNSSSWKLVMANAKDAKGAVEEFKANNIKSAWQSGLPKKVRIIISAGAGTYASGVLGFSKNNSTGHVDHIEEVRGEGGKEAVVDAWKQMMPVTVGDGVGMVGGDDFPNF